MRKIITLLALITTISFVKAKPIDFNTAKTIGANFLLTRTHSFPPGVKLELVYQWTSQARNLLSSSTAPVYLYVFNVQNGKGFVLVSGDDNAIPVPGYSDEVDFNPTNIPPNVAKWLDGYKKQIRYIVENHILATSEINKEWTDLSAGKKSSQRESQSVNPLVQTKWNQSPYYNALCPYDDAANELTVTGCVATATAQVMKFWNYPETGSGFHSYDHDKYGTLSANFGSTTYDWSSMPNNVTSANNAVATLMYQVGVGVNMNYGIASAGGSGAYVISSASPGTDCAEYALKTYFGYKNTLTGISRENYSSSEWISKLLKEFDEGRPVIYAGFGNGGGHCFVADGYDNNAYVHFNWGWGGYYDGYFSIDALNPGGVGTGGGTGGFNDGHQAIIGIEPPSGGGGGGTITSLELYDYVTPNPSTIGYGQGFTVSTNVYNTGSADFSGDFAAAVFDESLTFLDFIETKSNQSLPAGYVYNNDVVFSTQGMLSMLPGKYYIGIFYRSTDGNWVQVANSGSYQNLVEINVENPSDIELYSAMTVSPGTTLTQGKSASVVVNLLNNGANTFTGTYDISLYDLSGKFVQNIGQVSENNGLPVGYVYQAPFLKFQTSSITAEPGTYLLAVLHQASGGSWRITGSSYYQNPIKVTVKTPDIQPDAYEDNNTLAKAYNLPLSFSGNTATKKTTGSNCHVGSDYDYYKIGLASGYNYSITARLQDAGNSNDGKEYTLDAIFSYSTDGVNWSDVYDDVMSNKITASGGGFLYVMVSPYFTGETGSYQLDLSLIRNAIQTGIKKTPDFAKLISIYPNPTKDNLTLDLTQFKGVITSYSILTAQGQEIITSELSLSPDGKAHFSLPDLSSGMYLLRLQTGEGTFTKNFTVQK